MVKGRLALVCIVLIVFFTLSASAELYPPAPLPVITVSSSGFPYQAIGNYEVYFANTPNSGDTLRFVKDGVEIRLQAHSLNYQNQLNQLQQINMPQSIIATKTSSKIEYKNAYGAGIDLVYETLFDRVKETVKINSFSNLPAIQSYVVSGGNPEIELNFVMASNAQHIVIDGADWDKSTDRVTSNEVYIKDGTGKILYWFMKPFAVDSNGNKAYGVYKFKKSSNKLYVSIRIPYSFFTTATYPVYIDPTYVVDYSPVPALHLINGTLQISPDSAFEQTIDITSGISDNLTSTKYETIYESYLRNWKYSTEALTQSNTTSLTYVDKLTYTFTANETRDYVLFATAEGHVDSNGDFIYIRLLQDGATVLAEQLWADKEPNILYSYYDFITHKVISLVNGTTYTFKIQYHTSNAGTLAYIRNARISLISYEDYVSAETEANTDLPTGYTSIVSTSVNASVPTTYLILASAEMTPNSNGASVYAGYYNDGGLKDDLKFEGVQAGDWRPAFLMDVVNLTGYHTISIRGREEADNTALMRRARITVIPLTNSRYVFTNSEGDSSTTSSTWQTKLSMPFTAIETGQVELIAHAHLENPDDGSSVGARMVIDGTGQCEMMFESKEKSDPMDDYSFACQKLINVTEGQNVSVTIQYRSVLGGDTVYIGNARLIGVYVTNQLKRTGTSKAIKGMWSQLYNSTFTWFLRVYKSSVGSVNISVYAYLDNDTISTQGFSDTISGVGWFNYNVSSLMDYQTNVLGLNYTSFRFWTLTSANFSEVYLRKELNDTIPPNITNCQINDTYLAEGEVVRLSCNVTDNLDVDYVNGTVSNITYDFTMNGDIWYYDFMCNSTNKGLKNWTLVQAEDILENVNSTNPDLTFTCEVFEVILVDYYGLDSNLTRIDNFSTINLQAIEYIELNFSVHSPYNISTWHFNFTASGLNGCSLGNKQSQVCYNIDNSTYHWIQFIEGNNTVTYDGAQGNEGDRIIVTSTGNATDKNYSIRIDEHYNPNVFKWYDALYNFSDVKWQNGTNERITGGANLIKVEVDEAIIPLDADQYKLDVRVQHNNPSNPLEAYACNSSYVTGHPHDFDGCQIICSNHYYDLQSDGTKFRCVFTKELIDTLGDLKYVMMEHHTNGSSEYYAIKTYKALATNYTSHWEYSDAGGVNWTNTGDGYETELNLNWFYDGANPTNFDYLFWVNNVQPNSAYYQDNVTWDIDPVNNYPPIISIVYPVPSESVILPYDVKFSVADPNDDDVNVSLFLYYANGSIHHSIENNVSINGSVNIYYWNETVAYGTYLLTALVCEVNTIDLFCVNDTHQITIGCGSDWIANYTTCLLNNTQFKTYYDNNNCPSPPYTPTVPVDNGTWVSCNYCSEHLFYYDTGCGSDGYLNRTWYDMNLTTCCQVTNLSSDCSIYTAPYNETYPVWCGLSEMGNLTCQHNPNFNIGEKEYCIAYIPAQYANESFKCISYIRYGNETLQTNPQYKDRADSVFGIVTDKDTRQYFTDQNGIVNFYFTNKNLYPKFDYVLGLKCSSPQRVLTSEKQLYTDYENLEVVFTRTKWGMDNAGYIVAGIILLVLLVVAGAWIVQSTIGVKS